MLENTLHDSYKVVVCWQFIFYELRNTIVPQKNYIYIFWQCFFLTKITLFCKSLNRMIQMLSVMCQLKFIIVSPIQIRLCHHVAIKKCFLANRRSVLLRVRFLIILPRFYFVNQLHFKGKFVVIFLFVWKTALQQINVKYSFIKL